MKHSKASPTNASIRERSKRIRRPTFPLSTEDSRTNDYYSPNKSQSSNVRSVRHSVGANQSKRRSNRKDSQVSVENGHGEDRFQLDAQSDYRITCTECGLEFKTKYGLVKHKRTTCNIKSSRRRKRDDSTTSPQYSNKVKKRRIADDDQMKRLSDVSKVDSTPISSSRDKTRIAKQLPGISLLSVTPSPDSSLAQCLAFLDSSDQQRVTGSTTLQLETGIQLDVKIDIATRELVKQLKVNQRLVSPSRQRSYQPPIDDDFDGVDPARNSQQTIQIATTIVKQSERRSKSATTTTTGSSLTTTTKVAIKPRSGLFAERSHDELQAACTILSLHNNHHQSGGAVTTSTKDAANGGRITPIQPPPITTGGDLCTTGGPSSLPPVSDAVVSSLSTVFNSSNSTCSSNSTNSHHHNHRAPPKKRLCNRYNLSPTTEPTSCQQLHAPMSVLSIPSTQSQTVTTTLSYSNYPLPQPTPSCHVPFLPTGNPIPLIPVSPVLPPPHPSSSSTSLMPANTAHQQLTFIKPLQYLTAAAATPDQSGLIPLNNFLPSSPVTANFNYIDANSLVRYMMPATAHGGGNPNLVLLPTPNNTAPTAQSPQVMLLPRLINYPSNGSLFLSTPPPAQVQSTTAGGINVGAVADNASLACSSSALTASTAPTNSLVTPIPTAQPLVPATNRPDSLNHRPPDVVVKCSDVGSNHQPEPVSVSLTTSVSTEVATTTTVITNTCPTANWEDSASSSDTSLSTIPCLGENDSNLSSPLPSPFNRSPTKSTPRPPRANQTDLSNKDSSAPQLHPRPEPPVSSVQRALSTYLHQQYQQQATVSASTTVSGKKLVSILPAESRTKSSATTTSTVVPLTTTSTTISSSSKPLTSTSDGKPGRRSSTTPSKTTPSSSGNNLYQCIECKASFRKQSVLRKHFRTHTNVRPYGCLQCALTFKTQGNLTKHLKSRSHHESCAKDVNGSSDVPLLVDLDALSRQQQEQKKASSNSIIVNVATTTENSSQNESDTPVGEPIHRLRVAAAPNVNVGHLLQDLPLNLSVRPQQPRAILPYTSLTPATVLTSIQQPVTLSSSNADTSSLTASTSPRRAGNQTAEVLIRSAVAMAAASSLSTATRDGLVNGGDTSTANNDDEEHELIVEEGLSVGDLQCKKTITGAADSKHEQVQSTMTRRRSRSTSSSSTNQNTDPRPYRCDKCLVGFRVGGHLFKHYRSKSHLLSLLQSTSTGLGDPNDLVDRARLDPGRLIDLETGCLLPTAMERLTAAATGGAETSV